MTKDSPRPLFPTADVIVGFGSHEGKPLRCVPVGYLLWAIGQDVRSFEKLEDGTRVRFSQLAQAEIERRGSLVSDYHITGDAIDFLSRLHLDVWKGTREPDEGLHAWATRMLKLAVECIDTNKNNVSPAGRPGEMVVVMGGLYWYVQVEDGVPRLISVG